MTEEERALSDMLDIERQENARLKAQIENLNLCGYMVAKTTYNEVMNENTILKSQIEKMKCCANCKHRKKNIQRNPICRRCFKSSNWELAEK